MGTAISTKKQISPKPDSRDKSSKVLFFLHRTWAVIVTSKTRTMSRFTKQNGNDTGTISDFTSQYSQYSFCSCSQCQKDDGFSSGGLSDFFDSASYIAPNSDETKKVDGHFEFLDDVIHRENQRPPIYNPEDYAIMLKKWGKKSTGGLLSLYSNSSNSDMESDRSLPGRSFRDYRNPMLMSSGSEMTLRQFGTVSELLTKLKNDLKLAFPSFIQEFVADPLDGVSLLLDLLRAIQLSQSNTVIHGPPGSTGTTGKIPPSLQRRALLDELSCLQCLLNCCVRYTESLRKLISSSAGLFTVAVCIMSNVNKSRIIALQLLAKACDPAIGGHSAVSEAMSTLRLRFGEPVRFRFLVGMMTSTGGQKDLISSGLKFLNRFLDTAGSTQKRLYVQAELDQAGFDMDVIKKNASNCTENSQVLEEIQYWEKKTINVEVLISSLEKYKKESGTLRQKISNLERKIKELQDERGIFTSVEKCLKDRCSELQSEIKSLKSSRSSTGSYKKKRQDSTPNEDEGISSSERSITPEEIVHQDSIYDVYAMPKLSKSKTISNKKHEIEDEEEETTIEEVIEELRNIINDAESEDLAKKEQRKLEKEKRRIEEAQVASKLQIHIDADDYAVASESEIIPSELHPQPPRRAKSLVHLFVPSEDYYYCPKELFFENETPYTSTEGSDSLLSGSKCAVPRLNTPEILAVTPNHCKKMSELKSRASDKRSKRNYTTKASVKRSGSFKQLDKQFDSGYDGSYYYSTTVNVTPEQTDNKITEDRLHNRFKCKSLDRIDNGLDSMVDIVVSNQSVGNSNQSRTKSEPSKNSCMVKSVSNVYINSKPLFGSYSDDKQKMFLPSPTETCQDISYYFPRIQDKKSTSSSFLINRGHTNAGMYSGQLQSDNTSLMKTKEFLSLSNSRIGVKVTDLPSGLY